MAETKPNNTKLWYQMLGSPSSNAEQDRHSFAISFYKIVNGYKIVTFIDGKDEQYNQYAKERERERVRHNVKSILRLKKTTTN